MYKLDQIPYLGVVLFAAVSSSSTLQLNTYSLGSSSTTNSQSATYFIEGSAGELQGSGTVSTTYGANTGSLQSQQGSVPPAPTLSTNGGIYYNQLLMTVATGGNASDTTYSVAISTNNFTTTNYVQVDGTVGATPVYRTYSQWGGASGSTISGLLPNTTYKAKVNALQAKFTATAYGPQASATTTIPTLAFSLSPNTLTLGALAAGSVVTSSNVSLTYSTNGANGGYVYVSGTNGGLKSVKNNVILSSTSGDLSALTQGFGVQSIAATQSSGGPFTAQTPFTVSGSSVGAVNTAFQPIYASSTPVTSASASLVVKAKSSATTPAANDYQEILTFVAASSY